MSTKVIHVKPRRTAGPKRRRSRRPHYTRMIVIVLSITGILLGVGAVIGKGAKPYLVGHTEGREIEQINRQIAQEEARRIDLNKQIEYLQTPAGMESEARKLGWVKEGEVAVVVDDTKKEPTPERSSEPTFLQRIGKGITGLFSFTKSK